MTWAKKTDSPESRAFWSHVEKVAKKVRESEFYSNFRVPSKKKEIAND